MIGYASRTGTRRNLAALREAGWHLLISARGVLRDEGMPFALDNGAWTAFQRDEPFDVSAFERAFELFGERADWVVIPDIVAGGLASLDFSLSWIDRLNGCKRLLLAVQDGMTTEVIRPLLSDRVGIFVGGSTDWKLATAIEWGQLAHEVGCYMHVGRVNIVRRIRLCAAAGADSFDGTSATMFSQTLPMLDLARKARDLFAPTGLFSMGAA